MRQTGIVKEILPNGDAQVSVTRRSACGHDCASCGGGCGAGADITAPAKNSIGAEVGDIVSIESTGVIWAAFVVYIIPILCFIAGYALTSYFNASENVSIIISIAAFFFGLIPAKILNRTMEKRHKKSVIVSIEQKK